MSLGRSCKPSTTYTNVVSPTMTLSLTTSLTLLGSRETPEADHTAELSPPSNKTYINIIPTSNQSTFLAAAKNWRSCVERKRFRSATRGRRLAGVALQPPSVLRWASLPQYYHTELIVATVLSQIEALDAHSSPMMGTTGHSTGNTWPCIGPSDFDQIMVQAHSGVDRSFRNTWDIISVTRKNQELANLHLCRQCLPLWEDEMEKWGCNGLGERVGDRWKPRPKCGCYWYVPTTFRHLALLFSMNLLLCACD